MIILGERRKRVSVRAKPSDPTHVKVIEVNNSTAAHKLSDSELIVASAIYSIKP